MTEQIHTTVTREMLIAAHKAKTKTELADGQAHLHLHQIRCLYEDQGGDSELTHSEKKEIERFEGEEYDRLRGLTP